MAEIKKESLNKNNDEKASSVRFAFLRFIFLSLSLFICVAALFGIIIRFAIDLYSQTLIESSRASISYAFESQFYGVIILLLLLGFFLYDRIKKLWHKYFREDFLKQLKEERDK